MADLTKATYCEDCTFGCCCAEHGYSSHATDKPSELAGGIGIPTGHFPYPIGGAA